MARNAGISVENQFTKGLITEVTGVNSPENSVSESLNVIYDRKGRALKRKGLDYEFDYGMNNIPTAHSGASSEYVWDTAQTGSFVVIQFGRYLHFFSNSTNESLSKSKKPFIIDLDLQRAQGVAWDFVGNFSCSFSSGKDYLFVANPFCDPFYVKYDRVNDTLSTTRINIKIRDFEGVPDGLGIGERPGGLSNEHRYNLMNQGWYISTLLAHGKGDNANSLGNSYWAGTWPSNSDIPWLWKRPGDMGWMEFDRYFRDTNITGNSAAPKGHYILDAFYMQRNGHRGDGWGAHTTSGVPVTTSGTARPSCISFFMGRIFYSGVDADDYRSSIYFSQVVERDEQIGFCYQSNDPTSEHAFDLLANDGGVIKILDIGKIIDIRTFGKTLFVFAENGTWSISGTQTSPFSATDYTVSKVSSFGVLSRLSIVELGETPVWWNNEGIYILGKDQTGLEAQVTNASESTIQTFYDQIPNNSKMYAKGVFNDQSNLVYWLYSKVGNDDPYDYDSALVLDVQTQGFYPLSFSNQNNKISGCIALRGLERISVVEDVISNSDGVVTTHGEPIEVEVGFKIEVSEKLFKFVTIVRGSNEMTFSDLTSEDYLDFSKTSPEEYPDYFITGYRVRGDLMKKFQTNYLVVMTEDAGHTASCYLQGLWDYKTNSITGRFTNPQEVYMYDPLTKYHRRKLRIRGSGYSLQYKFYGAPGKPYIIIGWAGFETANATP